MSQAVDDHIVIAGLAQIERLDTYALDLEVHGFTADIELEIEFLQQLLVTDGPANIRPERQSDTSRSGRHGVVILASALSTIGAGAAHS